MCCGKARQEQEGAHHLLTGTMVPRVEGTELNFETRFVGSAVADDSELVAETYLRLMSTRRCPVSPASTVTTLLAVSVLGIRFIFFPAPRLVAHAAPLVPVQPALQHIPATTGANASAAGQAARVARPEPRTVRRAAATTGRESAPIWQAGPPPPPPFPPLHPLIFMQRNIDEPNCTALGGLFRNQVKLLRGGQKQVIGKCKRRCTVDPPPSYMPRVPMPPLRFAPSREPRAPRAPRRVG